MNETPNWPPPDPSSATPNWPPPTSSSTPAGWYPDPWHQAPLRYWNGWAWAVPGAPDTRPKVTSRAILATIWLGLAGIGVFVLTLFVASPSGTDEYLCGAGRQDVVADGYWGLWMLPVGLLALMVVLYQKEGQGRRGGGVTFMRASLVLGGAAAVLLCPAVQYALNDVGCGL